MLHFKQILSFLLQSPYIEAKFNAQNPLSNKYLPIQWHSDFSIAIEWRVMGSFNKHNSISQPSIGHYSSGSFLCCIKSVVSPQELWYFIWKQKVYNMFLS